MFFWRPACPHRRLHVLTISYALLALTKLYVPESAVFPAILSLGHVFPQEIGAYAWFWMSELPSNRDESDLAYLASGGKHHKFYMVCNYSRFLGYGANDDALALSMLDRLKFYVGSLEVAVP